MKTNKKKQVKEGVMDPVEAAEVIIAGMAPEEDEFGEELGGEELGSSEEDIPSAQAQVGQPEDNYGETGEFGEPDHESEAMPISMEDLSYMVRESVKRCIREQQEKHVMDICRSEVKNTIANLYPKDIWTKKYHSSEGSAKRAVQNKEIAKQWKNKNEQD